ncbi:MAG: hypothetical protein LIO46_06850, partial [Clostridiales bacterium]|nr:hypothetical protein [Clostridiales bacterium]
GGGTVVVSGGTYYCHTIYLKSGVTLYIDRASSLTASRDAAGFSHKAFLYAHMEEDIRITGGGVICGEGDSYITAPLKEPELSPAQVIDAVQIRWDYLSQARRRHTSAYGSLVCLQNCDRVALEDIRLEEAPWDTIRLQMCTDSDIRRIVISNNRQVLGNNGVVLMQCRDIRIADCFVSTGGDGVRVTAPVWEGCSDGTQQVLISGCELVCRANGINIGLGATFDIRDVTVRGCRFAMTEVYPGSMSAVSVIACDGGRVSDIQIADLEMERVTCPLFIRLGNRNRAAEREYSAESFDFQSELFNVTVKNVKAREMELPMVVTGVNQRGYGTKYVRNIRLEDMDLRYRRCKEIYDRRTYIPEYADVTPESWRFKNLPAYCLWARHVQGLSLHNIRCQPARSTWKDKYVVDHGYQYGITED